MVVLCFLMSYDEFREKFGNILIGFIYDKKLVYVKDLNVYGSMVFLLKDVLKLNFVQIFENIVVIVYGGLFVNIVYGMNSIVVIRIV